MQTHKDDRNEWNTSRIKVQEPIQEMSKPSNDKTLGHNSRIYYSNHLLFSNTFYLMLLLNFSLFINIILKYSQILLSYQQKAP